MITVLDVIRDLGLEPEKGLSWTVGNVVREKYKQKTGRLPKKELRPKTNGGGSHCFAVYPDSWYQTIREEVERQETFRASQISMWEGMQ